MPWSNGAVENDTEENRAALQAVHEFGLLQTAQDMWMTANGSFGGFSEEREAILVRGLRLRLERWNYVGETDLDCAVRVLVAEALREYDRAKETAVRDAEGGTAPGGGGRR